MELQPKLLRFLENSEVFQLGETQATTVDVRVIAATHRDLREMVRQGTFREDLFYRLAVVTLDVLPLRERREDVLALTREFLSRYTPDDAQEPKLSPEAAAKILAHPWPGNVRELRNVIERSLAFSPLPEVLGPEDLRF
jgi:transcriptional regulator with PAS, ATPase and Fis domain